MKKNFVIVWATLCVGFASCSDEKNEISTVPVLEDSQPSAVVPSSGFYVANEDWFGHDNGTVNYFKNDGTIIYRAYRAANQNETLGVTTQYATIWGEYAYFISKQGNRLVVADAGTLEKKAVFTELGGDGRSFVGVDDKSGYIGHSAGIRAFSIQNLELGNPVEGVTTQIGSMCYAGGRLFAVSPNKVYIIKAAAGELEKTLEGAFSTLTRSKDGDVWIAATANLIRIDPVTLEQEEIAYPEGTAISGSWGAWNAGSLCASTQNNILYWTKGTKVIKYDINSKAFNTNFYTLGKDEEDVQLAFYGAGLRIDPLSDHLIMTVKRSGWGDSGSFNWVHRVDANGDVEKIIAVKGDNNTAGASGATEGNYYWFPALPFFEDANRPEILINQIILSPEETKTIDLTEKIIDADNTSASIIRQVEFADNALVSHSLNDALLTVTAANQEGGTVCKIIAISNGKRVEKQVRIDVVSDKRH